MLPFTTTGSPCTSKTCSSIKCLSHTAVCSCSEAVSSPRIFPGPGGGHIHAGYAGPHSSKPDTESAKLILNTLLIGVFHFLTSLRSRRCGGGDLLPFASVIQGWKFWQPRKGKNFYERLRCMVEARINRKRRPPAERRKALMNYSWYLHDCTVHHYEHGGSRRRPGFF